jgi:hypothetical protein
VDAVFVILMGVGGYMMYAAYKGETPFANALALIGANAPASVSTGTGTSPYAPARSGTGIQPAGPG